MELDEVRKFLVDNHRGVLVARKRDGSPQITLVTVGMDGKGRAPFRRGAIPTKLKTFLATRRSPCW
jgi:hypothetical protein